MKYDWLLHVQPFDKNLVGRGKSKGLMVSYHQYSSINTSKFIPPRKKMHPIQ